MWTPGGTASPEGRPYRPASTTPPKTPTHPLRSTTLRKRHREILRKGEPPCALCGKPIDYTLPYMDPGEFVVDHKIPLSKGGSDTIDNKQPAHRACNSKKGTNVNGGSVIRRSTSLNW